MRKFNKIQTTDYNINTLQNNVESVFSDLFLNPILDAGLIENISVVSGDNNISHRLGRQIRGYIIVKKSANVNIYDKTSTIPDKILVLNSSGSAILSIIVF